MKTLKNRLQEAFAEAGIQEIPDDCERPIEEWYEQHAKLRGTPELGPPLHVTAEGHKSYGSVWEEPGWNCWWPRGQRTPPFTRPGQETFEVKPASPWQRFKSWFGLPFAAVVIDKLQGQS